MRFALAPLLVLAAALSSPILATTVSLDRIECVPTSGHAPIRFEVRDAPPDATVRVNFRLMSPTLEDFLYVVAAPEAQGRYFAVLPRVLPAPLVDKDPAAWRERQEPGIRDGAAPMEGARLGALVRREWMADLSDRRLQAWLARQENSPVEYFAEVLDADDDRIARSTLEVAPVLADCTVELTAAERSASTNIRLGETAPWQEGMPLLNWSCDGVLARIDLGKRLQPCEGEVPAMAFMMPETAAPAASEPYTTVKVYYGTDRARSGSLEVSRYYGGERGELEVGTCEVTIPVSHEFAMMETPGLFSRPDPEKHVLLDRITPKSRDEFLQLLRLRASGKSAFVFVHGYNVTFEDAARRTAQLGFDLSFDGAPIFYSWPSQGELTGYTVDEANIRWTVSHLQEFLELVRNESGAETMHLISHSMGNRALTEVLRRIAREGDGSVKFNQIVLAAPDVDAEVFRQDIAPAINGVGDRVTLYASSRDRALLVSTSIHGNPRVGDLNDGIKLSEGIQTIDASGVDTSLLRGIKLGHSYFADKATVLSDVKLVLAGETVDSDSRSLDPRTAEDGEYWWVRP